jgi:hypothetical protein
MLKRTVTTTAGVVLAMLLINVCAPEGDEPARVSLEVVSDGEHVTACENAEGWSVELSALRLAIRDLEFTIEGETHAGRTNRLLNMLAPRALAHPGHYAGGDVTGELKGNFVLDMLAEDHPRLGEAALLEGDYHGVNFYFRTAGEADGIEEGDPLLGHMAYLAGTATQGDRNIAFTATLDELSENTQMVGGPFELAVTEDTGATLALGVYTVDPFENDTLFDGIDFGALDEDDDGVVDIVPGSEAHNILTKTLERHDHYGVSAR